MLASGKYSSVEMGKGGGYVAIEKSPARHKAEELEAARILDGVLFNREIYREK